MRQPAGVRLTGTAENKSYLPCTGITAIDRIQAVTTHAREPAPPGADRSRTMDDLVMNDRVGVPAPGEDGPESHRTYRPRYEQATEQILQFIAELGLRPGDRMPTESELAARLGTSRTVVRDAVKILSATGRISAQKGRGLFVADGESMLGGARWGGFFVPTNLDHIF